MNWTLEDVIEFIEACYDRDTILDVLMGYSGYWFPARMTLIVGRAWVQLFATAAFDLPTDLPRELRRADVADDARAITEDVATGSPQDVGLGQLFEQLELGDPLIRTLGVRIGARVAIVLVGHVEKDVATDDLEAAAAAAGRQLEGVIRMAKANELPPVEDRIPPFPEPTEPARAPGVNTASSGRRTQNLNVAFEEEPVAEPPRHTVTVEQDDEPSDAEEVEESSNATSFGLPFIEGASAAPSEGSDADDEHPATIIGSPFVEEEFPGDIDLPEPEEESESDAIVLDDPVGGVNIVSPTDISEGTSSRTQLGGLSATKDGLKLPRPKPSDPGPGTLIGSPKLIGKNVKSTQLGGVVGDRIAVEDTLDRAESDAAIAAANDVLSHGQEDSSAHGSGLHGAWVNSRTENGIPTAMILKPARRRGSKKSQKAPASPSTSQREGSVPKAKKQEAEPSDDVPGPAAASDVHRKPTRSNVGPLHQSEADADVADSNKTSFGSWNRGAESTRKFDSEGEVDDAWFDYFADEAENQAESSESALNFSLSEPSEDPHTIPPETLERLLDSGPAMVDMQEQFMILDSRDSEKAFEAAEKVAELGHKAIEVLDLMFPGRVFLDRYQFKDDLPPVNEHGPVLHALVRLGDQSLSVASAHLNDTSNEARFYAVYLLTRLDAEPVLPELFDRLFDRDQQTRKVAAELVLQYQSASTFDTEVRDKIRGELLASDDVHVTVAATLLARLRDIESVEPLINAMDESATPRVKLAILNALTEITLHHWSSPYEWRQWWRGAKEQGRSEWLIEALDASSNELRQQAFAEVQRIPGLELNYHPDQPGKLRKRAQAELRSWFDR